MNQKNKTKQARVSKLGALYFDFTYCESIEDVKDKHRSETLKRFQSDHYSVFTASNLCSWWFKPPKYGDG